MKQPKYDIFISYRRDGGAQYARILQLMLEMKGYRVFLDYDELVDEKFSPQIEAAIKNSTIYLILLTKGSMARCANEGDWVRREIEIAIENGKRILPVNPDGAYDGVPDNVPQHIKSAIEDTQHSEVNFGKAPNATVNLMVKNSIKPYVHHDSWGKLGNDSFASTKLPICAPPTEKDVRYCCPSPISEYQEQSNIRETFGIIENSPTRKRSFWSRMFGKKATSEVINASAYAPAEIIPYKHFIVRVFIHRPEESGSIDQSVKDVDKTAVKKANKPLVIHIKEGDKISVQLSMTDGIVIDEPIQNAVWREHYVECDFGCKLTQKNIHSVLGKSIIAINNVPCGDLKFTIDVVSTETSKVYAPVEIHRYSKIFISYAHADYSQVRGIAEGCKMNGSDYFFDRHTLQAGDLFKDKIFEYIDNADLFVLCWSKNAAESEWVQIERKHALELIERGNHQLAIYPLSMPPEAPLPEDMSDKYNFASL